MLKDVATVLASIGVSATLVWAAVYVLRYERSRGEEVRRWLLTAGSTLGLEPILHSQSCSSLGVDGLLSFATFGDLDAPHYGAARGAIEGARAVMFVPYVRHGDTMPESVCVVIQIPGEHFHSVQLKWDVNGPGLPLHRARPLDAAWTSELLPSGAVYAADERAAQRALPPSLRKWIGDDQRLDVLEMQGECILCVGECPTGPESFMSTFHAARDVLHLLLKK